MLIATLPVPPWAVDVTLLVPDPWVTAELPFQNRTAGENHFPGSRFQKTPRLRHCVHL